MKTKILFILFIFSVLIFACADNSSKPLNPNGDSELAILMRQMHDNGMAIKAQLEKGEMPTVTVDYKKINTAKETPNMKPDEMVFKMYAQSYMHTMEKLEKCTNIAEAKTHFKNMQTNCLNCHQKMCPGPIVRINQLTLDD